MRALSAVSLACAGLFAAAASADAATVAVQMTPDRSAEVIFVAAPGAHNDVVVTDGPFDPFLGVAVAVSDSAAVITPGNLCEGVIAHSVLCNSPSGIIQARVSLEDMDDAFTGVHPHVISLDVDGGSGRDRLVAGAAR